MVKTAAPTNVRDDLQLSGQNGDDSPSSILPGQRVLSDLAADMESTNADATLTAAMAGNAPDADQVRDVGASTVPVHPAMAGPGNAQG